MLLGKGDWTVEVAAVSRHRRQVEAGLEQLLGQLACPVGAEVEEDRRVLVRQARRVRVHDRLDELVRDPFVIACLHCFQHALRSCTSSPSYGV